MLSNKCRMLFYEERRNPYMESERRISGNDLYLREGALSTSNISRLQLAVPEVCCHKIPDVAILDQKYDLLDYRVVLTHFLHEGRLSINQAMKLLCDAIVVLSEEPNVIHVGGKCYVFGDIHGQYYDLCSMLENFSLKKDTLVFVGDYVDRGDFSTETYFLLLLLKCHYPKNLILLRGNHECEKMTSYFTFRSECLRKYNEDVYKVVLKSFNALPLAAVIQNKALCIHGGISPKLTILEDLNEIYRFREPDYSGILCDILWSDPHPDYGTEKERSWSINKKRKCSFLYAYKDVVKFLKKNKLSTVIRGHEVQKTGYSFYKSFNGEPSLVSVFSSPNYCYMYKNMGAIIEYDNGVKSYLQFNPVSHPYILHGASNGFTWSMPLVAIKMLDLASAIFEFCKAQRSDEAIVTPECISDNIETLTESLRKLRTKQETASEIDKPTTSSEDLLSVSLASSITFDEALIADSKNESIKDGSKIETTNSPTTSPSELPEDVRPISSGGLKTWFKKFMSWL